ncbi:LLM class flavin-dependent oxidoreductase [Streptomyces sp. NPDC058335]|uniref:LLM class flavin-dependent oxidoreductase n=1 Tax=Streptomyces sp. NPDC058335 TaxID=3346451 RepID=UPI003649F61D
MTSSSGRGLPHLAAAVDLPGVYDVGAHVELIRLAERGGLDFVTLDDSSAGPGPGPGLDAVAVLSRAAPATHRVGLVPTVTGPHADSADVVAAVADLDRVSRGRAGRWIDVSGGETLLHAGLTGSPQGHPVCCVADATDGPARRAAARYADVVLARVTSRAQARSMRDQLRAEAAEFGREPDSLRVLAALLIDLGDGEHAAEPGHGGGGPRRSARGPLYRGGPVDLADLIASWHRDGAVDGFHLIPAEPRRDLERLVNGTVALLQHRGLFRTFYPGSTLREHLGLARPVGQIAGGPA